MSVTDPVGNVTKYGYTNGVLTEIDRPDGSKRTYAYGQFDGKQVVTQTTDEEGNSDSYQYASGSTTYTDASGVTDTHTFNANLLDTKIVHGDGSSEVMSYDSDNNLVSYQDELANSTECSYDAFGNVVKAIYPDGSVEQWHYNQFDKLDSQTDRDGNTTSLAYDGGGNLVAITYPDNSTMTFVYDAEGQIVSRTDQRGNTTKYSYDRYGHLATMTDPMGNVSRYTFDAIGRLLAYSDPAGDSRVYVYNGDNQLVLYTDSLGKTRGYTYDKRLDLTRYTNELGNSFKFTYDHRHLLTEVTTPVGDTIDYQYRADGKLIAKSIDGKSHSTYAYDSRENLVSGSQVETGITVARTYDAAGRLVSVTDPDGYVTKYSRDTFGRVTAITNPAGGVLQYSYDENGNVIGIVDPMGNRYSFSYDSLNRLVQRIDPYGQARTFAYDEAGNLISATDENGATRTWSYDPDNRILSTTDALGEKMSVAYTPNGLIQTWTDAGDNSTSYAHDADGRLVAVTDPLGGIRKFGYDGAGELTSITDPNGNTWSRQFDADGRLAKRIDPQGNATSYVYTYLNTVAQVTNPLGETMSYQYDPAGRILTSTNALGKSKSYTYDANSNLVDVTDELGRKTTLAYDSLNRLSSVSDALGQKTGYQYDPLGDLTQITYPNGSSYRYQYDSLSRLVTETNQLGASESFTYDPVGDPVKKIDFDGHETGRSFDALRRLTEVDYSDGMKRSFRYDVVGNLIHAENENGSLDFSYDADHRLIQYVDGAADQTLKYGYDPAGNRIALTWIQQNQTILGAYDSRNELTALTDARGKETTFTYDALGRELTRTLPNGVATAWNYDPAGRITAIKNSEHGGSAWGDQDALKSEAYLYNDAGERTYTVTTGGQVTAYRYDADGQLTGVQYPFGDDIVASALKERLSLGLVDTQGSGGRQSNREDNGGFFSKLSRLDLPDSDGAKLHDDLNVLLGRYGTRGALAIGAGATPFVSRLQVDSSTASALTQAYQMISPPNPARRGALDSNERAWTEAYTYDSVGNRQTKANGWGSIPYTYNPANEMVSAGNRLNTYDPNGNLLEEALSGSQTTYQYTPNNRISGITMDDTREVVAPERTGIGGPSTGREGRQRSQGGLAREVTYGYDAFSRRVARSVLEGHDRGDNPQTPVTTLTQRYLYDGRGFNVLAELNTSGTDAGGRESGGDGNDATNPAVVEYLRANGRLVERSAIQRGSDWQHASYYTEDFLGSTMQLTGDRGQVRTTYAYDVFGTAYEGQLNSAQNPYGYTGKRYDPVAMLYDYGMRDYNPVVGRWTTVDPVGAGNNWYGYANEDPVNFIDRWGLTASDVANANNGWLHQDDPLLQGVPGMTNNGCLVRTDQTIAEVATGGTMTPIQVVEAVLIDEAIGAIRPDRSEQHPSTSDMYVWDQTAVINTALAILGHPEWTAVPWAGVPGAISTGYVWGEVTSHAPASEMRRYNHFYYSNSPVRGQGNIRDPYAPRPTPSTNPNALPPSVVSSFSIVNGATFVASQLGGAPPHGNGPQYAGTNGGYPYGWATTPGEGTGIPGSSNPEAVAAAHTHVTVSTVENVISYPSPVPSDPNLFVGNPNGYTTNYGISSANDASISDGAVGEAVGNPGSPDSSGSTS